MYHIGLNRPFRAFHFLIGGDWGAENQTHSHDYRLEWVLGGNELDEHGYLLDLLAVEALLDEALAPLKEALLNDLPAFSGVGTKGPLNPSVERLTRHLSDVLLAGRPRWDPHQRLASSVVTVWENDVAWARWSQSLETRAPL